MSRWFDDAAKRAARDEVATEASGISRRNVIKRGAVVAGVAWTAPMLMQTAAAATSASACNPTSRLCSGTGTNSTMKICCDNQSAGTTCSQNASGVPACYANVAAIPVGSTCPSGSNATTTCGAGAGAKCSAANICGGTGATCTAGTQCADGTCSGNTTVPGIC
jgi:hypothetical protein